MTDDEAKRLFSPAIEFALDPTLPNDARETIRAGCRFALQAIADREALVENLDGAHGPRWEGKKL